MTTNNRGNTVTEKKAAQLESREIADRLVVIAENHKAKNIALYDLKNISMLADFFLVCSANSEPHIRALSSHFDKDMRDLDLRPTHVDGSPASRWIVVDYGVVVVHVFHPEMRDHYKLEELWEKADLVYEGGGEDQKPLPVF